MHTKMDLERWFCYRSVLNATFARRLAGSVSSAIQMTADMPTGTSKLSTCVSFPPPSLLSMEQGPREAGVLAVLGQL